MIQVELVRIMIQDNHHGQVIFLKECGGDRSFPIVIGVFEAFAIKRKIDGETLPRPMTHDLLASVIGEMGGELERIVINDLSDNTFFARLVIRRDGAEIEVDSRPSDAIALAVRNGAAIFVAEHVLDLVGRNQQL